MHDANLVHEIRGWRWLTRVAAVLVAASCAGPRDGTTETEAQREESRCLTCGGEGGGGIGECANACTDTTSCDTSCHITSSDGTITTTTCGGYGSCVSCDLGCTSSSECEGTPWCRSNSGEITTCRGAALPCVQCNYNNCRDYPGNLCSQTCYQPYSESWWGSDGDVHAIAKGYYACHDWGTTRWGDSDLDQVPDTLEIALARQFFPNLNMRDIAPDINSLENYSSYQTFYGSRGQYHVGEAGGTWLPFVVRPYKGSTSCTGDFECLEIMYAMLYNYDFGDEYPWNGWDRLDDDHIGDPESYSVLVYRPGSTSWSTARTSASYWHIYREFLAAHFCTGTDSSRVSTRAGGASSPQSVWVAEFKDASYPTQTDCNQGAFLNDACDTNRRYLTPSERTAATNKLRNAGDWTCYASSRITKRIAYPNATSGNPYRFPTAVNYNIWGGARFGASESSLVDMLRPGTVNWFDKIYDVYGHLVQDGTWTCWAQ